MDEDDNDDDDDDDEDAVEALPAPVDVPRFSTDVALLPSLEEVDPATVVAEVVFISALMTAAASSGVFSPSNDAFRLLIESSDNRAFSIITETVLSKW